MVISLHSSIFFLPFSAKVRLGLFNFILNDTAGGRKVVFNLFDNLCATDWRANFITRPNSLAEQVCETELGPWTLDFMIFLSMR